MFYKDNSQRVAIGEIDLINKLIEDMWTCRPRWRQDAFSHMGAP